MGCFFNVFESFILYCQAIINCKLSYFQFGFLFIKLSFFKSSNIEQSVILSITHFTSHFQIIIHLLVISHFESQCEKSNWKFSMQIKPSHEHIQDTIKEKTKLLVFH